MKTTKKYKAIYWKTCRRFWNQFKGYDSPGLRYDKRVSGNPKDHHCAKCQKSSTGKSLRYEIWGQVPWREREWQQRCAQIKDWNLDKNEFKVKEKGKVTFQFPAEEWVLPGCVNEKTHRKESLFLTRERFCIGSARETWLCWVGDHEDIKKSDDGQRRGSNQRRSDCVCQAIGLVRQRYASWRNSRSSFLGETLWGSWVYTPLDKRSKTTSHPKWKANWLQHIEVMYHVWFVVRQRVLPQLHLHIFLPSSSS